MNEKIINTRCILKNDSKLGWQEVKDTAILLKGEIGIEFNTIPTSSSDSTTITRIKIGDGVHTWSQLYYYI